MTSNKITRIIAAVLFILATVTPAAACRAPEGEVLPPVYSLSPVLSTDPTAQDSRDTELEDVEVRFAPGSLSDRAPSGGGSSAAELMANVGSEAKELRTHVDERGNKHVRMKQFHYGLPVVGGEVIAHFDGEGRVEHINGKVLPGISCGATPAL